MGSYDSLPFAMRSYQAFISDFLEANLSFEALTSSLSSSPPVGADSSVAIAEFALLISKLGVPGPSDLHPPRTPRGSGAQFNVYKQYISSVSFSSKVAVGAVTSNVLQP